MNLSIQASILQRTLWVGESFRLTVGDALLAALLVGGGWLVSRLVCRLVAKRMANRLLQSPRARDLAPRWTFFFLWSLFILAALRTLGVPLTIFQFLGGAVALGFGFGAQNLCSNLISGVIILVARPYRVGDIVEVNEQAGTVLSIGLRATEVRTFEGIVLVVPNSNFLSNTIVNRTNYERSLRGLVTVSVAYGTDSRLVDELLCRLAAAHPAVLTVPGKAPWVIFDNFGPSALEFKLFFWVDTNRSSVAAAASDIRHAILAAFREKGIAIPYPQLDVHLPQ